MLERVSIQDFLNSDQDQAEQEENLRIKEKDRFFKINQEFKLQLNLKKLGSNRLLVDFTVPVKIKLSCARCLKEFGWEKELKFQRLYSTQTKEDDEILPIINGEINIKKPLREELIVGLPLKPLCQQDCQGICPVCGQDLNQEACQCLRRPKGQKEKSLENYG